MSKNNKFKNIYDAVYNNTPFLDWIESGFTPEQIRDRVISKLTPFFSNRGILDTLAVEALVPEYVNINALESEPILFGHFQEFLQIFHNAKCKDPEGTFKNCAFWNDKIIENISNFWSIANLDFENEDLGYEDYYYSKIQMVGAIIEGCLKNLVYAIYSCILVGDNRRVDNNNILNQSLGKILNDLQKYHRIKNIFAPSP